ncbi:MAG: NusG domain II-containing protein [Methylotenera sp.]|nr:NusG domain II-containing protein [Methylotenera sp.]
MHNLKLLAKPLLVGDWLVLLLAILLVYLSFVTFWHTGPAAKVQISVADKVYATYSLNQQREVHVRGPLGEAVVEIAKGRARFAKSPCTSQYCVHQGWLSKAGQVAICIPNQISLTLVGEAKPYDTLNY